MDHSTALYSWRIQLQRALNSGDEVPRQQLEQIQSVLQESLVWLGAVLRGEDVKPPGPPRPTGPAPASPSLGRPVLYFLPTEQDGLAAGSARAAIITDVHVDGDAEQVNLVVFGSESLQHVFRVPRTQIPGGWDWPEADKASVKSPT